MKTDIFKFRIHMPKKEVASSNSVQHFDVVTTFPHYVWHNLLRSNERFSTPEQIRLAVAELKVRIIQEISNAEFEIVED